MSSVSRIRYLAAKRYRHLDCLFGFRRLAALDVKGEGAPFSSFGCHANLSTLQLSELAGNEQTQAGTTVLHMRAGAGLGEPLEKQLLLFGIQTPPSVLHGKF